MFAGPTSVTAQATPLPGGEPSLQVLDSLPTQGVYALQPLQPGVWPPPARRGRQDPQPVERSQERAGSNAARLFAKVVDARFDAEGRLLCLLVVPAVVDPRIEAEVRLLPAAAVHWDDERRQWLLHEPNLQFAELQVEGSPAPSRESPAKTPSATSWLASQLVGAALDLRPPGSSEATEGPDSAATSPPVPAPMVWMAGSAQRLALVVVAIAGAEVEGKREVKHFAVPWSFVRVAAVGGTVSLRVDAAPAMVRSAPQVSPAATPAHALRTRCYHHFGVEPPEWDVLPAAPRAAGR